MNVVAVPLRRDMRCTMMLQEFRFKYSEYVDKIVRY